MEAIGAPAGRYPLGTMTSARSAPEDPIAFIRDCLRRGRVLWTYHVNLRLSEHFIERSAILDAVDTYEVIEAYPMDKYLPSYLVLGGRRDDRFHVLFAADVESDNVRVVTAYRPDLDKWEPDLKSRRPKP